MTNEELHNEMVAAMKAKDKVRLSIVRQVMGEVKNLEVNERRDATEEDVNTMIKRLIKQTTETLEMSRKAGNNQERTDTKDMGRVMGALNKATGGNFDKAAAAKEVGARLA